MPYLHCPECRLSTYSAAGHSTIDHCPRCDASLEGAPRSLFALQPGVGDDPTPAKYTAYLMRKALVRTGLFREGEDPPPERAG